MKEEKDREGRRAGGDRKCGQGACNIKNKGEL